MPEEPPPLDPSVSTSADPAAPAGPSETTDTAAAARWSGWSGGGRRALVAVAVVILLLWWLAVRSGPLVELRLVALDTTRADDAAAVVEARAAAAGLGVLDASANDAIGPGGVLVTWPDVPPAAPAESATAADPRRVTDRDAQLLVADGPELRPVLADLVEPDDVERGELTIREDELRGRLGMTPDLRAVVVAETPSLAPEVDPDSAEFRELVTIEQRLAPPAPTAWADLRRDEPAFVTDGRGVLLHLGPVIAGSGDWAGAAVEGEDLDPVLVLSLDDPPPGLVDAVATRSVEGAPTRFALLAGPRILSVVNTPDDPRRLRIAPIDARAAFLTVRLVDAPLPTPLVPASPAPTPPPG